MAIHGADQWTGSVTAQSKWPSAVLCVTLNWIECVFMFPKKCGDDDDDDCRCTTVRAQVFSLFLTHCSHFFANGSCSICAHWQNTAHRTPHAIHFPIPVDLLRIRRNKRNICNCIFLTWKPPECTSSPECYPANSSAFDEMDSVTERRHNSQMGRISSKQRYDNNNDVAKTKNTKKKREKKLSNKRT